MLEGVEVRQQENELIAQAKALKEALQRRLRKECADFELQTGLTILSIDVGRQGIQTMDGSARSVLRDVSVRIEL